MTAYKNFVQDFPTRCCDMLKDYEREALLSGREVTLTLAMAASGLIVPFERLRPWKNMRLVVAVLLCVFCTSIARAFDTIACDEPNGFRYNYENTGEVTEGRDSTQGSFPTFKIDPQESDTLLVYWADSKPAQRIFPDTIPGKNHSARSY